MLLTAAGASALTVPFLIGTANAPLLRAQGDATPLAFEVASIKPVDGQRTWVRVAGRDGRFVADGASLRVLIQYAYGVQYFQVSGGPDWADSREFTYDIQAKPEGPATDSEIRRMLQSLLAERFRLKIRREKKDAPGYALTIAKGGMKLKENPAGDGPAGIVSMSPLTTKRISIPDFVDYLSGVILSAPIEDSTGLTGLYDFTLRWTPDNTQFRGAGGRGFYAGDPRDPTIFDAFEEQLGLKLESRKVATDYIVIERAVQPSEN